MLERIKKRLIKEQVLSKTETLALIVIGARKGVVFTKLEEDMGSSPATVSKAIKRLLSLGLIKKEKGIYILSKAGQPVFDDLAKRLERAS